MHHQAPSAASADIEAPDHSVPRLRGNAVLHHTLIMLSCYTLDWRSDAVLGRVNRLARLALWDGHSARTQASQRMYACAVQGCVLTCRTPRERSKRGQTKLGKLKVPAGQVADSGDCTVVSHVATPSSVMTLTRCNE